MAVQQNKVSKRKSRQRKASKRYAGIQIQKCSNCHAYVRPHRVCSACGYYKGRQVLTVVSDS